MHKKLFFSLTFYIILLNPLSLFAVDQFRCNGRIQYRPCGLPIATGKAAIKKNITAKSLTSALMNSQQNAYKASFKFKQEMQDIKGPLHAEIINANYQRYPKHKDYGQWRGTVKGNGDIHMKLLISNRNEPSESRYMGHVKLKNDKTTFNFVSAPPKSRDWSWEILAIPK